MVGIIDASTIRIGTEEYAEENDSFGLITLAKRHARVHGRSAELTLPGKSGRRVHACLDDPPVARTVRELLERRDRNLFAMDGQPVTAADVNDLLVELTGEHLTAKDFRISNGTLAAFCHLYDRRDSDRPADRVAVDDAAERFDNTQAVARAHYVHPHVLEAFTSDRFEEYLDTCTVRPMRFLNEDECALLAFVRVLLEREFGERLS